MQRYGSIIKISPEHLDEYKEAHAAVWPEILSMIKECNIQNYSIYYRDGFLFSYFEYNGENYDQDMTKMAEDPNTQRWWDYVKPMQGPLETRGVNEWWANMEEVFHLD
jgi:L-rhamnose mutarotase